MSGRARLLLQKRSSLKSQITTVSNLLDKGKIDNTALKLRMARLTELCNAFEDYNDELEVLEPDAGHQAEFEALQERFYALAGRVENIVSADSVSNADTGTGSGEQHGRAGSGAPGKGRRIKLPEATLPTFDGKYEHWLSFKNAFQGMIGSQTDLTDIDKLHYLKSALTGEAANKVRIFAIDGINYTNAWDLLERSYEVKRVLVSQHLSMMLNMPVLERETTCGLTKLADDAQQHVASLRALDVDVGPEMIVHIIEGKLPRVTSEKWEASLERDEFPKPDQLYEFLYKAAVCASRRERTKRLDSDRDRFEPAAKRKRNNTPNQAFLLNASRSCVACKVKRHPLYACDQFRQWPVLKRIETVKNAKLCYNCLRSHRDSPCKFSSCTICQKRHNTLLHNDKFAGASGAGTSKPAAATAE